MKAERIEELKTNGHTPGPWRPSASASDAVVCDESTREYYNDDAVEYYGGHLIAESIATDANRELIAAAPELLAEVVRLRKEVDQLLRQRAEVVRRFKFRLDWIKGTLSALHGWTDPDFNRVFARDEAFLNGGFARRRPAAETEDAPQIRPAE